MAPPTQGPAAGIPMMAEFPASPPTPLPVTPTMKWTIIKPDQRFLSRLICRAMHLREEFAPVTIRAAERSSGDATAAVASRAALSAQDGRCPTPPLRPCRAPTGLPGHTAGLYNRRVDCYGFCSGASQHLHRRGARGSVVPPGARGDTVPPGAVPVLSLPCSGPPCRSCWL